MLSHATEQKLIKVKISGNDTIKSSDIKKQLRHKPLPAIKRIAFWIKRPEFNNALMKMDSENISLFLQSNGFLYAEVEPIVNEGRLGRINIEYKITENNPVRINSVKIVVNDTLVINRPPRRPRLRHYEDRRVVESQVGKIFKDDDVYHDVDSLNDFFVSQGYLRARTEFEVVLNENIENLEIGDFCYKDNTPQEKKSTVDIEYHTATERQYYMKGLQFTGNRNVDSITVKNQLVFQDSLLYRREYITKSRDNLMRLGVFRSIQIYPNFIDDTEFVVPTIRFIEQNKWVTTAGIGWGSEERVRAFAQVSHHGMYKKADQQQLSIRYSYLEPWNVQFRLIQPAFFHPKLIFMINPFIRRENKDFYMLDRLGNDTRLSYYVLDNWNLHFSYLIEQNKRNEIEYESEDWEDIYNLSTYSTVLDVNYSHPKMNPYRGFHSISEIAVTEIGFDSFLDYYLLSQEFRYYQPIYHQFILALRGQVQVLEEIGGFTNIPRDNKLYLGGIQSVRGYDRQSMGPYIIEDGRKIYVGGMSTLLFNAEARIPVVKNFDLALLYDAGQVMENAYDFEINNMAQSVGVGLRWQSPIGRIRFDAAWATDKSNPRRLYLTIGESF